jgi:hypothetical protein
MNATMNRRQPRWKSDPATPAMLGFLKTLLNDRACPLEAAERLREQMAAGTLTKGTAGDAIDWLKQQPRVTTDEADEQRSAVPTVTEPGIYAVGDTEVYLVVKTRDGQRLYAKRLVNFDGTRLTQEGEHVKFEWEFAPGVVHRLTVDQKMSVEQGKAFMLVYRSCLRCNRPLKAATSVERGIGPVCIKYFA